MPKAQVHWNGGLMTLKKINYEDVAYVCNELISAGEAPSTLKVFKSLGCGSFSTIQKHIGTWKESEEGQAANSDALPITVELPEEFKVASELYLKKIHKLAADQYHTALEEFRKEKENAVSGSEEQVSEAMELVESVNQKNDDLYAEIEGLLGDLQSLKIDYGKLECTLNGLRTQAAEERSQCQAALAEKAIFLQKLEKYKSENAALKTVNLQFEKAAEADRIESARLNERLTLELEARKQLQAQTEKIQKDLANKQEGLDALREEKAGLLSDIAEARGRFIAMEQQISTLREELVQFKAELEKRNGQLLETKEEVLRWRIQAGGFEGAAKK